VESLAAGRRIEQLLADFPYLEGGDVREALAFAARLAQGREIRLISRDLSRERELPDAQAAVSKHSDAPCGQLRLQHRQGEQHRVGVILSAQKIRFPKENEGWAFGLLSGEDCAEICVRRDHDAVLVQGPCEDRVVACRVHSVRANVDGIVSCS
jgi:hypothetical protein